MLWELVLCLFGGEVGKGNVPVEHQGVRDRDLFYRQPRRRDAAPGGDKMKREVPPAVSGGASLKIASWGAFSVTAHRGAALSMSTVFFHQKNYKYWIVF